LNLLEEVEFGGGMSVTRENRIRCAKTPELEKGSSAAVCNVLCNGDV